VSLASVLARGQAAALARMTDACTIRRQTGTTYNDEIGGTTPTWTAVYSGACRVKQPSSGSNSASRTTVGEAEVLLQQPELHLPMSAPLLRPGDEVTITASATDPTLVGRVFRTRAIPAHSQASARRHGVTERTS
jgi:hypothetical protein